MNRYIILEYLSDNREVPKVHGVFKSEKQAMEYCSDASNTEANSVLALFQCIGIGLTIRPEQQEQEQRFHPEWN